MSTHRYDDPMSWMIRCIAAFVLIALCAASLAQTAPPGQASDVTLKSLRALSEQIPQSADSEDELQSQIGRAHV